MAKTRLNGVDSQAVTRESSYSGRRAIAISAAVLFLVLVVSVLGLSIRGQLQPQAGAGAPPGASPAPKGPVDSAQAGSLCSAAAAPDHLRVVAAYDTTESRAIAMDGPGGHQARPIGDNSSPNQPVVVCFLDRSDGTEFPVPHPPDGLAYTRERLTLTLDGRQYQPAYGSSSYLPALRPS
jgi:hypothetical protein